MIKPRPIPPPMPEASQPRPTSQGDSIFLSIVYGALLILLAVLIVNLRDRVTAIEQKLERSK